MNTQEINEYDEIIKAFDLRWLYKHQHEKGILLPHIMFILIGLIFTSIGLFIKSWVGWIIVLFGTAYLLFFPEYKFIRDIIKKRNDLFERVWIKGRVEWVKMINYLASQYTAEAVWKKFQIGKSSLVGTIGGFAIGHLLGYIGTKNDSVNWRIAEYLLIAWIIAKVCVEVKNVFLPSRKYNIELALKGVEKFRKAKESKIKK